MSIFPTPVGVAARVWLRPLPGSIGCHVLATGGIAALNPRLIAPTPTGVEAAVVRPPHAIANNFLRRQAYPPMPAMPIMSKVRVAGSGVAAVLSVYKKPCTPVLSS